MSAKQYVSLEEVRSECRKLGLRDWTALESASVPMAEARVIMDEVNETQEELPVEDFRQGLEIELEHGLRFKDANVTSNHPLLTGMIVLAHLKESLLYYKYLRVAELEADILKAVAASDMTHMSMLHARLTAAKRSLAEASARFLAAA
jgi:hypothetical protein